jgi:hypothetical protein
MPPDATKYFKIVKVEKKCILNSTCKCVLKRGQNYAKKNSPEYCMCHTVDIW